jgi:hypothetical protein
VVIDRLITFNLYFNSNSLELTLCFLIFPFLVTVHRWYHRISSVCRSVCQATSSLELSFFLIFFLSFLPSFLSFLPPSFPPFFPAFLSSYCYYFLLWKFLVISFFLLYILLCSKNKIVWNLGCYYSSWTSKIMKFI